MPLHDSPITRLMVKYARREPLSEDEMRTLEEWWRRSPQHAELAQQFGDEDWVKSALAKLEQAPDELWAEMSKRLDAMGVPPLEENAPVPEVAEEQRVRRMRPWITAAKWVAVAIPAGIAFYLWTTKPKFFGRLDQSMAKAIGTPDVPEYAVIWTGNDGKSVDIGNLPVGSKVSTAGSVILRKVDTNSLAYDPMPVVYADGNSSLQVGKNRSQFHIRMPDGSTVWLAGGSRLDYPLHSRGLDHPASLSGLGYFDVIKDAAHPWVIFLPDDRRILVHGTVFVARGEKGKPMKVSLLTGNVQVDKGKESQKLLPGEEVDDVKERLAVRKMTDPLAATAWVNSSLYFHFHNTSFDEALNQVANWYGYSIQNLKGIKGTPITDDVWRPASPEKVVQAIDQLETNYASVHIRDRTIVVEEEEPMRK